MKRLLRKPLGLALILSVLLAGGMWFGGANPLTPLEHTFLDLYFQNTPEEYPFTPAIALVEINDLSTHYRQRWPWDPEKVAELLKKISSANPKAIALAVPLLDERKPGNLDELGKALKQFNELHPPPAAKKDAPKPRRSRRRRRRRSRLSAEEAKRRQQRQKKVATLRKSLTDLSQGTGLKELQEVIKKTPNLVLGYVYYKRQKDVPGADVPYFQQRDLELKKAADQQADGKSKKKSGEKSKVLLDQLFRPLGKARFVSGAANVDPAPSVYGLRGNPNLAPHTRYNGFVNIGSKPQHTVRNIPLFVKKGSRTYPSLALATYIAVQQTEPTRLVGSNGYIALENSGKEFALTPNGRYWLNFYGPRSKVAPKQRYLAGDIIGNKEFPIKSLEGKIVLIGLPSGTYGTPMGQAYTGLELQATLLANLLQRRGLHRTPTQPLIETGLLVLAALVLGFLMLKLRWFGGLVVVLLLIGGLHIANLYMFFPEGTWYKLAYIDASLLLIYFLINWIRDITDGRLRANTKARFEDRLHADDFEKIIHKPEQLPTAGLFRPVTVLSGKAQPMGSHITEEHDPRQIVHLMSNLTNPMVDVVRRNHGMIHHLDGHTYQALFNAPIESANHPEQACMAALQLQFEWDSFVPRWQQEGLPVPSFGIGLDTGSGVVGNFGGEGRFVYSFLGTPLEFSEQLQELNQYYGSRILLSENLYLQVQDNPKFLIRELDQIEFVEDQPTLTVYELLGTPSSQVPLGEVINWYQQGLIFYRQRNFQEAIRYFQEITRIRPNDGPAHTMLQRSQHYLHYPPNFQWDGSWKIPSTSGK